MHNKELKSANDMEAENGFFFHQLDAARVLLSSMIW